MTARLLAVLRCDHAGCANRFTWLEEHTSFRPPRLHLARRAAGGEGWRHGVRRRSDSGPSPTVDLCPVHSSALETLGASEVLP